MSLNLYQRVVLLLAALAVSLMVLFPPWMFVFQRSTFKLERFAGYHPIWRANTPTDADSRAEISSLPREMFSVRIDNTRLTIQVAGVLLITFLVIAFLQPYSKIRPARRNKRTTQQRGIEVKDSQRSVGRESVLSAVDSTKPADETLASSLLKNVSIFSADRFHRPRKN